MQRCFTFIGLFTLLLSACVTPSRTVTSHETFYMKFYKDRVDPGNQMTTAGPNYTVEKTAGQQWIYKEYFFDTGILTRRITYASPALQQPQGPATEWFDDGSLWEKGNYQDGKKDGAWKELRGPGGESMEGTYAKGSKEGLWTVFGAENEKVGEIVYKFGEIISQERFDQEKRGEKNDLPGIFEAGSAPAYPCSEQFAGLGEKCGERSLMTFLASNINYPGRARENGVTGKAFISFVVGKDGSVQDVVVLRGISNDIRVECLRVVSLMPAWKPGEIDGDPVKVRYLLPLRFKLE